VRRSQEDRIIAAALRCYSAKWRARHRDEATLLASELLDDGTPWWSVAGSFLRSAARDRAFRRPRLPVGSSMAALAIGLAAVPLALVGSLTTAGASNTTVTIVIAKPGDAVRQLESAFASHHFNIAIIERSVSTDRIGSILSISPANSSSDPSSAIKPIPGPCTGRSTGCIDGLVLPLHYSGRAFVTIGVATSTVARMNGK